MAESGPALPPPPRALTSGESRALLFGHGVTLLGAAALLVGGSLVWLFVAGYALAFSAVRPLAGARATAPAIVERSGETALWTGEPARRTDAVFSHQGRNYRAVGYGETSLSPGQPTRVVYPLAAPEQGWVMGLQRFPLRLRGLLNLALVALTPAGLLGGLGILLGSRQRWALRAGSEIPARRTRRIGLARPFSELFLDRFEWQDGGRTRGIWSVGSDDLEQTTLLVSSRGVVVVQRLLPRLDLQGAAIRGVSAGRKLRAWLVLAVLASQAGALCIFLLT